MSKTRTGKQSFKLECGTDGYIAPPSGPISGPSLVWNGVGPWIVSARDFPVSPIAQPDGAKGPLTLATSGRRLGGLLARLDPESSCWKMLQGWLSGMAPNPHTLGLSLLTLPSWGMTQGGALYRLETPELPTGETDGGAWPTPRTTEVDASQSSLGEHGFNRIGADGREWGMNLVTEVSLWPTPNGNSATYSTPAFGENLQQVASRVMAEVGLWMTPTSALEGTKTQAGGSYKPGLKTQAKLWATPTAKDFRTGEQNQSMNGMLSRQAPRMLMPGNEFCENDPTLPPPSEEN